MLAAKIPKTNTIKVVEEEIPVPKKGEVPIKMKASGYKFEVVGRSK